MKILSLIREQDRLVPAEVEISFIPGLPQIQVLGLPDQVIKESLHRIRSAFRHQNFELPKTRQVIVNIKPVDHRKNSKGLELAIAAGLLWASDQQPRPVGSESWILYGELGLDGRVFEPNDLETDFRSELSGTVLTGSGPRGQHFPRLRIPCLADLLQAQYEEPLPPPPWQRPVFGLRLKWTEGEARLLSLIALGEHHSLLAGAGGGGKSTLARAVASFLAPPTAQDRREGFTVEDWRPLRRPHHTLSELALIGGGIPPRAGEITKSHRGLLVLDELLEFSPRCQEALREPLEEGLIHLSRGTKSETLPANFLLVGTTNLCPCGRWQPGKKVNCYLSARRCRSNVEKISGPFFDRFDVFAFSDPRSAKRDVPGTKILEQLEVAREFQSRRKTTSSEEDTFPPRLQDWFEHIPFSSERRRSATLRVARHLADLDLSEKVLFSHLEEALVLTWKNLEALRRGPGV